jgi:Xaa-Pro aminopeptidase
MLRADAPATTRSARVAHAARLQALRAALTDAGLSGFIVPHADEHQSEYLPPSAERLAWLTGFTGSAGSAIVLAEEAAVFVDGRYTLQAAQEVDASAFQIVPVADTPAVKWLAARLKDGDRVGYDPWLLTLAEVRKFGDVTKAANAGLVAVAENPIDDLWRDRPTPPVGQVSLQPVEYAGESAAEKVVRLKAAIAEKKADYAVLALADSIAWTFNIRGSDIGHNPVPLAFALLAGGDGRAEVFIDGRKLSNAVRAALSDLADVREPAALLPRLAELGKAKARVLLDPNATASAIGGAVTGAGGTLVEGSDPAVLPKAKKNATELAGARRAHVRDGAAMVRFLAWLDRAAAGGDVDEIVAAEKLTAFRAETAARDGMPLADLSFDTISGAGPNGAIVHYRVSPASNRKLVPGELYLIDSGGQYRDGTTDVTRTVFVGGPGMQPTGEMRDRFTRVLKGHIAIAAARFPVGTTGAQLDTLARTALWSAGLDYDHGTGHGVGSYLAVHEGPARISKVGTVALEPGMILSNEPGYYKTGSFGIRTENLVVVKPPETVQGGEKPLLAFETLTLAPVDLRLVDRALLTADEIAWIDAYHARILPAVGHLLDEEERAWLTAATQRI